MANTTGSKGKSMPRNAQTGKFVTTLKEGYIRKGGMNATSKITVRPAAAPGIKPGSARVGGKK